MVLPRSILFQKWILLRRSINISIPGLSWLTYAGGRVDAIIIDFAKAFDIAPHHLLIQKVQGTDTNRWVVALVNAFLRNRKQRVRIGNSDSNIGNITCGVTQGSAIGPLLLLIFINDLPSNVMSLLRLFTDDCIMHRGINCNEDEVLTHKHLDQVYHWAKKNYMGIN